MKNKIQVITFPVFCEYVVHIEFTKDLHKTAAKYDATRNIEIGEDTKAICVHEEDCGMSFMFLPFNSNTGDIAHESWHVVKRMMEYVGVELDSETVAYHLGYLVNVASRLKRK